MRRASSMLALVWLVSVPCTTLAQELVTSCGQVVTNGALADDLDCSGFSGDAVQVAGTLTLNGHTLTVGAQQTAIGCIAFDSAGYPGRARGSCSVTGPGTVRGAGQSSRGVMGNKRVRVDGVAFEDLGYAVVGGAVFVSNSAVTGCGISGLRATVIDSSVSGSWWSGVEANRRVTLVRSTVTGSRIDGVVSGGTVQLSESTVTGNVQGPDACDFPFQCGFEPHDWICADVTARRKVKVDAASSCGTSLVQGRICRTGPYDYRDGTSFGACALD